MKIRLPQYSGKDYLVLAIVILPFTFALNSILFGSRYFTEGSIFLPATLLTSILFAIVFVLCGALAIMVKKRMPDEEQTTRRLFLMIFLLIMVSGLFLLTAFHAYEMFPSFNYTFNEKGFIWAYLSMAIVNIFITLLLEGISRYENWRENLKETEKLKKAFTQSQLLGLKSQVNPHFLFNSLNTLSSLIQENEEEAEEFLNQMSKVYRYMLRGDDEQLVPLSTEMRFIQSYLHLLGKRFGQSLQVKLNIQEEDQDKLLPPLSLQVLIENAFNQNVMSKADPLLITICSNGKEILVRNTRKPKMISNDMDIESGLDNLVTKYRLLNNETVVIKDEDKQRSILLPLIQSKGGLA